MRQMLLKKQHHFTLFLLVLLSSSLVYYQKWAASFQSTTPMKDSGRTRQVEEPSPPLIMDRSRSRRSTGRHALILFLLPPCTGQATEWTNALIFLKYGLLHRQTRYFDSVKYIFLYTNPRGTSLRIVQGDVDGFLNRDSSSEEDGRKRRRQSNRVRRGDVLFVEVPPVQDPMQCFLCVMFALESKLKFSTALDKHTRTDVEDRPLSVYDQFIWVDGSTARGPFFHAHNWQSSYPNGKRAHYSSTTWVHILSGLFPEVEAVTVMQRDEFDETNMIDGEDPPSGNLKLFITTQIGTEEKGIFQGGFLSSNYIAMEQLLKHVKSLQLGTNRSETMSTLQFEVMKLLDKERSLLFDLEARAFVHFGEQKRLVAFHKVQTTLYGNIFEVVNTNVVSAVAAASSSSSGRKLSQREKQMKLLVDSLNGHEEAHQGNRLDFVFRLTQYFGGFGGMGEAEGLCSGELVDDTFVSYYGCIIP